MADTSGTSACSGDVMPKRKWAKPLTIDLVPHYRPGFYWLPKKLVELVLFWEATESGNDSAWGEWQARRGYRIEARHRFVVPEEFRTRETLNGRNILAADEEAIFVKELTADGWGPFVLGWD